MTKLSDFSRTLLRQLILARQSELDRRASTATNAAERAMIQTDREELSLLWEEIWHVGQMNDDNETITPPSTASEAQSEPPKRRGRPPKNH